MGVFPTFAKISYLWHLSFMWEDPIQIVYFIISLLVVLSVHEASHALVAYYLGDPTAKIEGRLTLNPVKHLDLVGSLLFLLTLSIGWGKPVPVNPRNFKHPVRDNALTALAGPVSNFVLAFFIALPLKYIGGNSALSGYFPQFLQTICWTIFHVSIFLGIFNLFPFPPLDGSKILGFFVPAKYHRQYLNYLENGIKYFIVIFFFDFLILRGIFDFSVFGFVMGYLHDIVRTVLLLGT